jgi:membrane-bound lytic murein transglycosylase D
MMRSRSLLLMSVMVCAAGCATLPPTPDPALTPAASLSPEVSVPLTFAESSLADYKRALEESYAQIVARENRPVAAPRVDVEAAASIPLPQHRTIDGALSYFTTDLKADIQTSLIRSAKYKPLIDKVLDEYKLPRGLAYLPVIESAYMPTLTSRAGAHGIWQIMPDTARELGLRVDWWVDERADPERSTRAAANYLRTLYRQFNDWPLTLAAYNCGPSRVRKALHENNASTFWELLEATAVPKETRGYVPTFFATLIIASDPATYGFRLGDSDWTDDSRRVEMEGPLSLKTIAEAANLDEGLLRELNPAFRHGIVPPGRMPVRVPARAAQAVEAKAATLKNEDTNVAVCSYVLREGDSVKRLARAIGTTPETLLAMNNLRSAKAAGEGDTILLPLRARDLSSLLAHAYDNVFYAVRKGDTLYSIAHKHNISIAELRELNQLDRNHKLHPGEKLRVSATRALTAGGM